MKNRVLATVMSFLLTTLICFAQSQNSLGVKGGQRKTDGSTCDLTAQQLQDGTLDSDWVAKNSLNCYTEYLLAGHSYSVEVWDPWDAWNGYRAKLQLLDVSCNSGPSYTDVAYVDPVLFATFAGRISWIVPADDYYNIAVINQDSVDSYDYNVRLSDTTLHSSRWSTWSGFGTQYAFVNETSSSISGILTVTESGGAKHTLNITIPANSEAFRTVQASGGDVNVGANKSGFSDFAYVGPEGAVMADAVIINASATVIEPVAFAARNYQH